MSAKSVDQLDERNTTEGYEKGKKEIEKYVYLKYPENKIYIH